MRLAPGFAFAFALAALPAAAARAQAVEPLAAWHAGVPWTVVVSDGRLRGMPLRVWRASVPLSAEQLLGAVIADWRRAGASLSRVERTGSWTVVSRIDAQGIELVQMRASAGHATEVIRTLFARPSPGWSRRAGGGDPAEPAALLGGQGHEVLDVRDGRVRASIMVRRGEHEAGEPLKLLASRARGAGWSLAPIEGDHATGGATSLIRGRRGADEFVATAVDRELVIYHLQPLATRDDPGGRR